MIRSTWNAWEQNRIFQATKQIVISWWVLARVYFWIYFLNLKSFSQGLGQLVDIVMGNILKKNFTWFGGLSPKCGSFLSYQPNAINQKPTMMRLWLFTLLKVCIETIKNSKHHELKINRLHGQNLKIMKRPGNDFQSSW